MLSTSPLGPAFRGRFVRSPTISGPLSLSSKYPLVSDEIGLPILVLEAAGAASRQCYSVNNKPKIRMFCLFNQVLIVKV